MKSRYMNQTVLFETNLFGRWYFWMKDTDDTIYLVKSTDGYPDFS